MRTRGASGSVLTIGVVVTTFAMGCREPAPAPADLIESMKRARAAAASASAVESAEPGIPSAPAPAPAPALTLSAFDAQAPLSLCVPAKTLSCALDLVNDTLATDVRAVNRNEETKLVGWATDGPSAAPPPVIFIELASEKKKFYAPAMRITRRPDVAAALKVPAMVNAGYDALTSLKDVDPGEYAVHVVQINQAGASYTCETGRKLKVE